MNTDEWGKMNARRGELIHKKLMGTITPVETAEYDYLQKESLVAIEKAFPFFEQEDEQYEFLLEERLKKMEEQ